jgi:hypothetical protein
MLGSDIRSAFDSVGVMTGSFDHARVGAVSAVVQSFENLRDGGFDCFLQSLRRKNPPGR